MSQHHHKQHDKEAIAKQLQLLEDELKALELWGGSEGRPSAEALASPNPFGIDSIEFHEWLEYILIERLRELLDKELPLPEKMMVHTYAQEFYRGQWGQYRKLIGILQSLDRLISLEEKEAEQSAATVNAEHHEHHHHNHHNHHKH